MKALKGLLLVAAALSSGCAINLSSVKFEEKKPTPTARFAQLNAEQSVCEVERELALFTDENKHLWLSCPYRYEGRTIPLVAYIGPDTQRGAIEFTYAQATEKIRTLKKETLRRCGTGQYCADLSAYGYMDFTVKVADRKARSSYLNLSAGLKEVEAFYSQLDGSSGAAPTLDAQLVRLVKPERVAPQIERLATLAQYRVVAEQLKTLGLADTGPIGPALRARGTALEVADFRQQGTFAGFQSAYRMTRSPADLEAMQRLAAGDEQKSALFAVLVERYNGTARTPETLRLAESFATTPKDLTELAELKKLAEQERLAEVRRQEEARVADLRRQEEARQAEANRQEAARLAQVRRQEEARLAEERAAQARAEEEKCLRNAACRQAWEERKAQCVQKVRSCREGCDRVTGSGSYGSFIANLSAAALARACYAGCKCENGFGDLVTKFNQASAGAAPSSAAATTKKPTETAQAVAKPKAFECKIYCKSASGPSILRRIEADSRKAAAQIATERAGEFCAADGKQYASSVKFSESQCQEK